MNLLVTFLVAVTIGIVSVAWVGVIVDKMTSPFVSLLIFFPLFFLTIWLCWKLAVKIHRAEDDERRPDRGRGFPDHGLPVRSSGVACPIASKAVPLRRAFDAVLEERVHVFLVEQPVGRMLEAVADLRDMDRHAEPLRIGGEQHRLRAQAGLAARRRSGG